MVAPSLTGIFTEFVCRRCMSDSFTGRSGVMLRDPSAGFDCIVRVTIRSCSTDQRLFEQAFFVRAHTWEVYRARLEDLHILISDIAGSYSDPVFIDEKITQLPTSTETPEVDD